MSLIAWTSAHTRLDRHRHRDGYATLILEGGYCESGDAGRFRVGPGDVLLHGEFEAHGDTFGSRTTKLLDMPLTAPPAFARGRVADPDAIVRFAERDLEAAGRLLIERLTPDERCEKDWPDRLARELRADRVFALSEWAAARGLHPGSVSRGFGLAYGVSPQRYRLEARAREAALRIRTSSAPLAVIAAETEFADQAHMSRTVRLVTGSTPRALRAA